MLMIKESDDFYTKPFANQENLQLAKQLLEKAEVTRVFFVSSPGLSDISHASSSLIKDDSAPYYRDTI